MAIWQHQIFILPKEEIDSFFCDSKTLTIQDLDNIEWWKFRKIDLIDIDRKFSNLLKCAESWSKDLIIYGNESTDCLSIILEDNIPVDISARFDSRDINSEFIERLIDFALENNLIFLNDLSENNLEIIYPDKLLLQKEVSKNQRYKMFLKKLRND